MALACAVWFSTVNCLRLHSDGRLSWLSPASWVNRHGKVRLCGARGSDVMPSTLGLFQPNFHVAKILVLKVRQEEIGLREKLSFPTKGI